MHPEKKKQKNTTTFYLTKKVFGSVLERSRKYSRTIIAVCLCKLVQDISSEFDSFLFLS